MARLSRRRLLAAGGGAALASGVLAQVASAQADKPRRSPWDLTFDVAVEPPTTAAPGGPAMEAGAFYVTGAIYEGGTLTGGSAPATAKRLGTLHVTGWNYDPTRPGPSGSVALAVLDLTGRGQIVLAGGLVSGRTTIAGGTGEWRGANGQADLVEMGGGAVRAILDYSRPYEGT